MRSAKCRSPWKSAAKSSASCWPDSLMTRPFWIWKTRGLCEEEEDASMIFEWGFDSAVFFLEKKASRGKNKACRRMESAPLGLHDQSQINIQAGAILPSSFLHVTRLLGLFPGTGPP